MAEKVENKTELFLELEGNVNLVEKDKDGNVVSVEQLDAEIVLKSLIFMIEESIRNSEEFKKESSDE